MNKRHKNPKQITLFSVEELLDRCRWDNEKFETTPSRCRCSRRDARERDPFLDRSTREGTQQREIDEIGRDEQQWRESEQQQEREKEQQQCISAARERSSADLQGQRAQREREKFRWTSIRSAFDEWGEWKGENKKARGPSEISIAFSICSHESLARFQLIQLSTAARESASLYIYIYIY